jgi:hypothetical protein
MKNRLVVAGGHRQGAVAIRGGMSDWTVMRLSCILSVGTHTSTHGLKLIKVRAKGDHLQCDKAGTN